MEFSHIMCFFTFSLPYCFPFSPPLLRTNTFDFSRFLFYRCFSNLLAIPLSSSLLATKTKSSTYFSGQHFLFQTITFSRWPFLETSFISAINEKYRTKDTFLLNSFCRPKSFDLQSLLHLQFPRSVLLFVLRYLSIFVFSSCSFLQTLLKFDLKSIKNTHNFFQFMCV